MSKRKGQEGEGGGTDNRFAKMKSDVSAPERLAFWR